MTGGKSAAPTLDRAPLLTLPEQEAAFLRAGYEAAQVILEYGSGGSTAMAAAMPGKVVWSVESDADWVDGMRDWFDRNPPKADVNLVHADIGPTGKWGRPVGTAKHALYHHYPLDVWDSEGFTMPDTVLIDGRFRAACFLAVAFRATQPVTVYFDDYVDRPKYHEVERFGPPVEVVGRMARFEVEPKQLKASDLGWIMDVFARVQ